MSTHLEESLQRDFGRIRDLVAKMAQIGEHTLRDGVVAIEKRDRQLAYIMILRDQRIDQLQKEIDGLCLEFLVRHQPAGGHLRFVYAALQVNFELERVGDYAESIARQLLKLLDLNCAIPAGLFTEISSASISMLHNAVNAFVREDADLAGVTAQIEEQVDTLRNQANSELLHLVQNNQIPLAALSPLMTIARRFERVSDQAKSICQETLYFSTGEYAKHAGAQVYRVLFVDAQHGCLSRLAQGIGRSLHRAEFAFDSAGINPQPLAPMVINYLRDRGMELSSQTPMRLPPRAAFEQYSIVVAFSPAVKDQLPPATRKSVQLEWPLDDPCVADGKPEEIRAGLDQACAEIARQLSELVAALFPDEQTQKIP